LARKKKTPSDAKPSSEADVSKAEAISGAVKDADFDTPDAAMADTSLNADEVADADVVEETTPDAEPADEAAQDATADAAPDKEEPADTADVPEDDTTADEQAAMPAPPPPAPEKKGGFFGTLMGGVLAAVIGFGGAIYFKAAEWPVFGGTASADLEARFAAQSDALTDAQAALAAQIEALQSSVDEGQAADAATLTTLTERLDALPTTTAELMPDDLRALLAAQKEEMDALQANLDQMSELTNGQIASAQEQQEQAAMAEARAKARGALNAVRSALASGDAYAAALPDIAAATEVPDVLAANADSGVPSADTLTNEFGPAARTALSASLKETAGDAPADRVLFFLKDQLGARSLTPQEGDDPNAVLSRVEAAVRAGDLDAALEGIPSLPEQGQAALQSWVDKVATRKDALAAFDSLTDALSAN